MADLLLADESCKAQLSLLTTPYPFPKNYVFVPKAHLYEARSCSEDDDSIRYFVYEPTDRKWLSFKSSYPIEVPETFIDHRASARPSTPIESRQESTFEKEGNVAPNNSPISPSKYATRLSPARSSPPNYSEPVLRRPGRHAFIDSGARNYEDLQNQRALPSFMSDDRLLHEINGLRLGEDYPVYHTQPAVDAQVHDEISEAKLHFRDSDQIKQERISKLKNIISAELGVSPEDSLRAARSFKNKQRKEFRAKQAEDDFKKFKLDPNIPLSRKRLNAVNRLQKFENHKFGNGLSMQAANGKNKLKKAVNGKFSTARPSVTYDDIKFHECQIITSSGKLVGIQYCPPEPLPKPSDIRYYYKPKTVNPATPLGPSLALEDGGVKLEAFSDDSREMEMMNVSP